MWRQILGMTAYITFIMVFMFFFIDNMWGWEYSKYTEDYDDNGLPTGTLKVKTMLFNTFIYFHIFNEINCRAIKAKEFNVFANISTNFYFIAVIAGEFIAQYYFVQWGGKITQCTPLDGEQHAFCLLFGSSSLLVSLLLKLTPESLADKIPKFLDESEKLDESNKTMKFFNSANTKVTDIKLLKKSAAPAEPETKNEDEEQKSA